MIEKFNRYIKAPSGFKNEQYMFQEKINELVDVVNELHKEAKNNARIRADHEKFIATLFAENNMHEKQIESYKKWYDKTVKQCKTCGNVCIITTQGEQK